MNWDMIGALGELVGAIAVVLTLVYLARQIRESSAQDRRHQAMQLSRASLQNVDAFARDPALSEIWLRGLRDAAELDDVEMVRFSSMLLNMFQTFELTFQFGREGAMHDSRAEASRNGLKDVVASPGVPQWWADRRNWFSHDFQAEVDRCIAEGAEGFLKRYDKKGAADA